MKNDWVFEELLPSGRQNNGKAIMTDSILGLTHASWDYEKDAYNRFGGIVVGVDEAGRGPLAEPVVTALFALDAEGDADRPSPQLDDSKKLLRKKRREYLISFHL